MGGACSSALGRTCVPNSYSNSGKFAMTDSSVLSKFKGAGSIAKAADVSSVTGLAGSAGYGTL
jgi:pectin lyase